MKKENLKRKIAEALGVSNSEKELAFEVFREKVADNLDENDAIKIPNLGIFQLKIEDTEDEERRSLICSPVSENYSKETDALYLKFELAPRKKNTFEFDPGIFSIGVQKPIIPLSEDADGDSDSNVSYAILKKSIEERVTEMISGSTKLENFNVLDDYFEYLESDLSDEKDNETSLDDLLDEEDYSHGEDIDVEENELSTVDEVNKPESIRDDIQIDSQDELVENSIDETGEPAEKISEPEEYKIDDDVSEEDEKIEDEFGDYVSEENESLDEDKDDLFELEKKFDEENMIKDIESENDEESESLLSEDIEADYQEIDEPESDGLELEGLELENDEDYSKDDREKLSSLLEDESLETEEEEEIPGGDDKVEETIDFVSEEEKENPDWDWGDGLKDEIEPEPEEDKLKKNLIVGLEEKNDEESLDKDENGVEGASSDLFGELEDSLKKELENEDENYSGLTESKDDPFTSIEENIEATMNEEPLPTNEKEESNDGNEPEESKPVFTHYDRDRGKFGRSFFIIFGTFVVFAFIMVYLFVWNDDNSTQTPADQQQTTNEEGISVSDEPDVSVDNNEQKTTTPASPSNVENNTPKRTSNNGLYRTYETETRVASAIFFDGSTYNVQVSSWRSPEKAESEAKRIKNLGYDSYVMKANIPKLGGTWYRVRIGSFKSKEEAQNFQRTHNF